MTIARQLGPGDKFPEYHLPVLGDRTMHLPADLHGNYAVIFFITASGDRTVFGRSPITRTILKSSNKRISRSWPSPSILWTSRRRYISHWRGLKVPADADQVGAYWEERRGIIHGTGFTVGPDQRILQVLLRHRTDRPNRCSRCLKFDQGSKAQKSTEW
jgi:hypothetical protein